MKKWGWMVAAALLFAACSAGVPSTCCNLDFEYAAGEGVVPLRWAYYAPGYRIALDAEEIYHGDRSLSIAWMDSVSNGMAFFALGLPMDSVAGREVELKGWIKTDGVSDGFAGLWMLGDDESREVIVTDGGAGQRVTGTCGWTEVAVRKKIGSGAFSVSIGGVLKGKGRAWFDQLEVSIDGVKYTDEIWQPNFARADLDTLRRYVCPLHSSDPDCTDTDDLKQLGTLIGNSSVVALGENTHGSAEIYRMKDRIARYLAANEEFGVFALEANMPESYRLNDYTVHGQGDPKQLIAGMYFWTWQTHEMLALVEWMNRFNQGRMRIAYTGVDMQEYAASLALLKEAFRGDKLAAPLLDRIGEGLDSVRSYSFGDISRMNAAIVGAVDADLLRLKSYLAEKRVGDPCEEWLQQQVVLLEQYLHQASLVWRDRCMAENLLWIKRRNPGSKIVLWAHNGHITKERGFMGGFLKDSLGGDYTNIGFTFYEGCYTALGDKGLTVYPAREAYPGTVEYLLGQLDVPLFLLDMKKLRTEHPSLAARLDEFEYRHVGAVKYENEFNDFQITKDFDYLIYIHRSTPSHLFYNFN